jgi:hypothetical protein
VGFLVMWRQTLREICDRWFQDRQAEKALKTREPTEVERSLDRLVEHDDR